MTGVVEREFAGASPPLGNPSKRFRLPLVLVVGLVGLLDLTHAAPPSAVDESVKQGRESLLRSLPELKQSTPLRAQYPLGCRALTAYALFESGSEPGKVKIQRLLEEMATIEDRHVYSLSVYVLALDAWHRALSRSTASVTKKTMAESLATIQFELARVCEKLHDARSERSGLWGYSKTVAGSVFDQPDLSNSGFAVMALQVARSHGISVSPRDRELIVRDHLAARRPIEEPAFEVLLGGRGWWTTSAAAPQLEGKSQVTIRPDGTILLGSAGATWHYQLTKNGTVVPEAAFTTFSMTASTLSSLLQMRQWYPDRATRRRQQIDEAIVSGLAHFVGQTDRIHGVSKGRRPRFSLAIAFSVERALDLAGIDTLQGRPWFSALADQLIAQQQSDGSWGRIEQLDPELRRVETAFAVLTLSRAGRHLSRDYAAAGPGDEPGSSSEPKSEAGAVADAPGAGEERSARPEATRPEPKATEVRFLLEDLFRHRTSENLAVVRACLDAMPGPERKQSLTDVLLLMNGSGDDVDRFAGAQLLEIGGLPTGTSADEVKAWLHREHWPVLRGDLESAPDLGRRQRLRRLIASLGDRVLPDVEAILQTDSYLFDWVLVREAITGRRRGLGDSKPD